MELNSSTIQNAIRFLPAFDMAIKTRKNVLIPTNGSGMKISSLRQRASEALLVAYKYSNALAEHIDLKYNRDEYLKLRASVNLKPAKDGIVIAFKQINTLEFKVMGALALDQNRKQTFTPNVVWKDTLIDFIKDESKDVLSITNLNLPPEDQVFINELLKGEDWLYEVTENYIRVCKEKE